MTDATNEVTSEALPRLPPRADDGHKGTFGRVELIGGWPGMTGAISLSAMAALRSGAGLVRVVCPRESAAAVSAHHPAYMTQDWDPDADRDWPDAVGFGPGVDRWTLAPLHVAALIDRCSVRRCPIVIDATGLDYLAAGQLGLATSGHEAVRACDSPVVLTPHPGEFARLTGLPIEQFNRSDIARRDAAAEWARNLGCVIVLKGAGTVVTDGVRTHTNATGNSGLATGGTGDVLTGIITALLAEGLPAWEAARIGVHAHGLAGDIAAATFGRRAMTAVDVVESLPAAWRQLENGNE